MKNSIVLIFLFLQFANLSVAQPNGWNWQNPLPQGNNLYDMCSDPTHEGRYVAVGDYGTILVKDDQYLWHQMVSGTRMSLYSVCFSQTSGWIVGNGGIILHNTDGGVTWSEQNSGTTKMLLSVYFTDFLHGWAVGQDQTVLYTSNMGETWNDLTIAGSHHYFSVYFTDYLNGWIAGAAGSNGLVKKSTDGGVTWSNSLIPNRSMNSIKFINDSVGCVVGNEGRIYTTGNRGKNWSQGTSNTTSDLKDVYLQENGEGWAVGYSGTIIYTTDYGNNWTVQVSPIEKILYNVEGNYIVGWGGVILENEGTWTFESSLFYNHVLGIDFGADAIRGFAAGEKGQLYYTSDAGSTWVPETTRTDYNLYAIDVVSGAAGWTPLAYIVGERGTVLVGSHGDWRDRSIATTDNLYGIYRLIGGKAWVAGEWGRIWHTTNSGRDWTLQHENTTYHLQSIYFTSSRCGWAAGISGAILRTTNGGEEWLGVSPNNTDYFRSIFFIDSDRGWVVGNNGAMFSTTDGGNTWTPKTPKVTNARLNTVRFVNENMGWVAGEDGIILHTTNGGENWYFQNSGSVGELRSICFPESNSGWIGGFDGLILHTEDGGGVMTYNVFWKKFLDLVIRDPGESSDTLEVSITPKVSAAYAISSVTVTTDSLIHPNVSDLVLLLTHEGITDTLVAQGEISGSDIIGCKFSDGASAPIAEGEAPYADNHKPHSSLSVFNGLSPNGEWKLTVVDMVSGNAGVLQSWGLKIFYELATCVDNQVIESPRIFKLYQNYPNPFNPMTTIKYDIPKASYVTLKVFNMLGQEVAILVDEKQEAGSYEVQLNGFKLPSGVYFYQFKANNYSSTKKLILTK
jgi:photosystem II stability/assembly factor-like uncharacterized protein